MGLLIIGPAERELIWEAIAQARARPIPWDVVQAAAVDDRERPTATLSLGERPPAATILREIYPAAGVELGTYRAAITFEHQPVGLLRHLSVSTTEAKQVPNQVAFVTIVSAFGFSGWPPTRLHRVWTEEFEPDHWAINLVELELAG